MKTSPKPRHGVLAIVGNVLVLGGLLLAIAGVIAAQALGRRPVLVGGMDGSQWTIVAVVCWLAVMITGFVSSAMAESALFERSGATAYHVLAALAVGVSVPTLLVSVVLAYGHDYTEHVLSDGRSVVVDRHAGLIPCDVRLLQRDGIHIVPVSHAPEDATCGTVPEDDLIMGNSDGTVSIIIGEWEETVRLR